MSGRARSVVAAVVLLAVFVALYALSNLTAGGQRWENWLLRAHDNDGMFPALLGREIPFPPFDSDVPTVVVGTVAAMVLAVAARRWRVLVVATLLPGAALVTTQLFKDVFGRPHLIGAVLDTDVSYPSGHTAIVLGVSAALLLAVPAGWLQWAALVLAGWCGVTTAALQSVGYHRPSEVLGTGVLLPAVLLLLTAAVGWARPTGDRAARAPLSVLVVLVAVVTAIAGAWNDVPWAIGLYAAGAIMTSLLTVGTCLWLRADARPDAATVQAERSEPSASLERR